MSYRLGADSETGSRSKLLRIAQTKFLSCIQDLMRSAFRSTEVDKLIDIIHDAGRPEDVQRDYAATQGPYGEAVRLRDLVNMIGRLSTATAIESVARMALVLKKDLTVRMPCRHRTWDFAPPAPE